MCFECLDNDLRTLPWKLIFPFWMNCLIYVGASLFCPQAHFTLSKMSKMLSIRFLMGNMDSITKERGQFRKRRLHSVRFRKNRIRAGKRGAASRRLREQVGIPSLRAFRALYEGSNGGGESYPGQAGQLSSALQRAVIWELYAPTQLSTDIVRGEGSRE